MAHAILVNYCAMRRRGQRVVIYKAQWEKTGPHCRGPGSAYSQRRVFFSQSPLNEVAGRTIGLVVESDLSALLALLEEDLATSTGFGVGADTTAGRAVTTGLATTTAPLASTTGADRSRARIRGRAARAIFFMRIPLVGVLLCSKQGWHPARSRQHRHWGSEGRQSSRHLPGAQSKQDRSSSPHAATERRRKTAARRANSSVSTPA